MKLNNRNTNDYETAHAEAYNVFVNPSILWILMIISVFVYIMMLDYNQEPISATKRHQGASNSA